MPLVLCNTFGRGVLASLDVSPVAKTKTTGKGRYLLPSISEDTRYRPPRPSTDLDPSVLASRHRRSQRYVQCTCSTCTAGTVPYVHLTQPALPAALSPASRRAGNIARIAMTAAAYSREMINGFPIVPGSMACFDIDDASRLRQPTCWKRPQSRSVGGA
ncbi:hypothetical protein B0H67DRAFT_591407 [Lasiosphaeris hirsuta]|uniref:Uncharacterized protein n=1 Tax=Lasiosphaeris hirsuta TaxID=260670 RepID=A0AA39ZVS1_9PEZI|nr:hypothetical protein B0H67DRAFT_591407 [Lasiosphaeris hirsuta]